MTATHEIGNLSQRVSLDQAANPFAMTDLRAKPEIARGRLDVERTPRGLSVCCHQSRGRTGLPAAAAAAAMSSGVTFSGCAMK